MSGKPLWSLEPEPSKVRAVPALVALEIASVVLRLPRTAHKKRRTKLRNSWQRTATNQDSAPVRWVTVGYPTGEPTAPGIPRRGSRLRMGSALSPPPLHLGS